MQLTYADVLKAHPEVVKIIKLVFDCMKEFNIGKSSTLFHERAAELGSLCLKTNHFK